MASFQAIPKAKDLLDYTMERTTAKEAAGSTKPRFPKSQSFGYCKALRDAALSILERIQAANDYYFETQFEERLIALDEVLQKMRSYAAPDRPVPETGIYHRRSGALLDRDGFVRQTSCFSVAQE